MRIKVLMGLMLVPSILFAMTGCGSEENPETSVKSEEAESADVAAVEEKEEAVEEMATQEEVEEAVDPDEMFTRIMEEKNIQLKARDVQFDMQNNLDQKFAIMGNASLDTYYNYGFSNLEQSHFAVSVEDEGAGYADRWVLYFDRSKFSNLYETLKKGDTYIAAAAVIPKAQYEDGQDALALGVEFEILGGEPAISKEVGSVVQAAEEYKSQKGLDLVAQDVLYDMENHLDKEFLISGTASLDTYYNYGFIALEKTHFAVGVWDESTGGKWTVYFDRKEFAELFETLKQTEEYVAITGIIPSSLYEDGQGELAKGLDISIGTGY